MAKDKKKLQKLSLDQFMWRLRAEGHSPATFWVRIKGYLHTRIKGKNYLNDFEIELLNKYVGEMKNDERIAYSIRNDISRYSTRLIVMSKSIKDSKFVEKVSYYDIDSISNFKPEEILLFFETAVKYAFDCLSKKYFKAMLDSLVCDAEFLESIRSYVKENTYVEALNKKINNINQKCNITEVFREFPNVVFSPVKEELSMIEGKNILTVDKPGSKLLDSAFSIEKKGNLYFYDVYVSDVPSFLLQNEELLKFAYEMGTSMYNYQQQGDYYKVDMIPYNLSKKYLSLNKNDSRNVITFSFCIDEKGSINLVNISRNKIVVDDNIDTTTIRGFEFNNPKTDRDVAICKEMCRLVSNNANSFDYVRSTKKRLGDVVAFPSIIVNYQVGRNSSYAIYRENGKYVKNSDDKYAYSVTPLRKFVSDINLALYLSELGLINCPDKYIHYVEDNIDSIIEHLNRREDLCEYFETNYREVKKYFKK